MPDRAKHCPFLNRSDARCSDHFNIDHLQHALGFCFGRYKACTTYVELLIERRILRNDAAGRLSSVSTDNHAHPFVKLTVSAGHAQHAARAA